MDGAQIVIDTDWRYLQNQGQLIGLSDTLIAGICIAHGLPLLTKNVRHYERVAGLQVIHPDEMFAT